MCAVCSNPAFKARGESAKTLTFQSGGRQGERAGSRAISSKLISRRFSARAGTSHPRKQELRDFVPEGLWQADYGEIGTQRVVIRPEERPRNAAQGSGAAFSSTTLALRKRKREAIVNLAFSAGVGRPIPPRLCNACCRKLEQGEALWRADRCGRSSPTWRDENFPEREQPTGEVIDRLPSPRADRSATHATRGGGAYRRPSATRPWCASRTSCARSSTISSTFMASRTSFCVELAREVGKSKREREEMSKGMRKKELLRKKAREDSEREGPHQPVR